MKKIPFSIYLLVVLQLTALTTPLFAADWIRRSADAFGERVRLTISDKHKIYYEALPTKDVLYEITGPATMHIITRVEISGENGRGDYNYQWQMDKDEWVQVTHYAKPSENASLHGTSEISVSRRDEIEVSEGTHYYRFNRPQSEQRRLFFRVTSKRHDPLKNADLTPLQPTIFGDIWQIIVREINYDYYVARSGEEIVMDVVGPTTIKVVSRLDYDAMMMGEKSYRIKVHEDEQLKNTYAVTARPSSVAYYENQKGHIPGRGSSFFVSVPAGRHSYRFEFVDGAQTSLMRFYIPHADLDQRQ